MEEKTELLKRAASGDRRAAADLVDTYSQEIYRLALYLLKSQEEAQDAAADIFLKIYSNPTLIPPEKFRPWLMRVTYNHCHDILRRKSTFKRLLPRIYAKATGPPEPTPEQSALEASEKAEVRKAIEKLPEQEKVILFLRYYQELSYEEISNVTDIPPATVGTRLHRTREKLRNYLTPIKGGAGKNELSRNI
ncbi:MAG: RNA polymerase sigma factor [Bacillota bacterium]